MSGLYNKYQQGILLKTTPGAECNQGLLRKTLLERNEMEATTIQELQEQNTKLQNEKSLILQELEFTKSQFTSLSLQNISKNKCIKIIGLEIKKLKVKCTIKNYRNCIAKILCLIRENEQINHEDNIFFNHFNEEYQGLCKKLTDEYKELSEHDLEICIYVCMKLYNKQIAQLLHISLEAIKQARKRIKRKLGLDHQKKLEKFLLNI